MRRAIVSHAIEEFDVTATSPSLLAILDLLNIHGQEQNGPYIQRNAEEHKSLVLKEILRFLLIFLCKYSPSG